MQGTWHQINVTFRDRAAAQQVIPQTLGPALLKAEDREEIATWWFMNKQPWKLRVRTTGDETPTLWAALSELVRDGQVRQWIPTIYEPETLAFGGTDGMEAAHELFHADSRHLLTYPVQTGHLGRRETAVLLVSAMMRAAGLDWYEQGDVWDKVAAERPTPPILASELDAAMHCLLTVDARTLCREDGPLHGHADWVRAFARAGTALAVLNHEGRLRRGLRAVLAHHVIFHFNRAGLPLEDQSALSNLARKAIMGTSDTPATTPDGTPAADSVGSVNTDTLTTPDPTAEQLRNALVDQIRQEGHAVNPAAEAALRTVPRHLFVPDASLQAAYANQPVHVKYDTDGTSISCASQPAVVALMLDQLDAQPGERILELGAGTGYNAALLAHLVGDTGHVTTIDVDDDLVERARAHLAAAGYTNVDALTRDGAVGYADGAPYDRIIATVGAHGIPHAWLDQLAPDGRLVVPQRIKGSVSRSIVYERRDGRWISLGSEMNTFMPLRRGIADDDRRIVSLSADGTVRLQAPAGMPIDAEALARVLEEPRVEEWTGMTVRAMESPEWMELFVSCSFHSGLIRMLFPASAKGTTLTEDPYPSSTAVIDRGGLTYLARRLSDQTTPEGGKLWEFGVIGHGPGSDELAAKVAEVIRTWDRNYRSREATFELQSLQAPASKEGPGRFSVDTPLNRIVIDFN
ncbi:MULTISPECIES: methyltransferase, FxLD system [Streptomyces]|uniref:methyltransferase, FxLD system n=1 Tax=Streptomyces TaxID=1883 RepID=UPI0006AED78A|nr:methyltransferase, FxLD system [Streptomyces sp. XY511]KOU98395.1 protein-L-isoaspartate O-methyltransferase [Streptomyces sp. XY511]